MSSRSHCVQIVPQSVVRFRFAKISEKVIPVVFLSANELFLLLRDPKIGISPKKGGRHFYVR